MAQCCSYIRGVLPNPGFNGPFWSLVYEVFYYLFFAAVALALLGRNARIRTGAAIVAVALGVYGLFEPNELWVYSTIWLLGMVAAQSTPFRGKQLALTLAVLGAFLAQTYFRFDDSVVRQELIVTLLVVTSILTLQRWQPFDPGVTAAKLLAAGAAMSYSLYLFHAPAMNLFRGILEGSFEGQLGRPIQSGVPLFWYPCFIAVGCAAGAAFWWCFERHTMVIRRALERRFGIGAPERHQPIPANLPHPGEAVLPQRGAAQIPSGDGS